MRIIIYIIFILATNLVVAQTNSDLQLSRSSAYVDEVKTGNINAFYTTESGLTGTIRGAKKSIVFDVFNKDLIKVSTQIIETHKKEKIVGDLFYGNEIRIFTEYAAKKDDRVLYCHIFNIEELSHTKVPIYQTKIDGSQTSNSDFKDHKLEFAISEDGKLIAIADDFVSNNTNFFLIRVFNAVTLEEVYRRTYLEDSVRYFKIQDLAVDNNATAYTLGKYYLEGRSQKKKGEANYEFVLNKITAEASNTLNIELGDLHIQSLSISLLPEQIHLLGMYSEKNVNRIKGGCNFIVDKASHSIVSKFNNELPNEVYEGLYGSEMADEKSERELANFDINYLLSDDKSNTYLLAEEFYITTTYMAMANGGGTTQTTPHYDDILILKFNSTGSLEWGRALFKRSTVPSYNAFMRNGELQIILNSGKSLREKQDGRTKISHGFFGSAALYNISFSAEGEVSYNKILDYKDNYRYLPHYGAYHNEKFIMTSSRKDNRHFAILE